MMKKGLKITAIVLGVLIALMMVLPFAFRGKIEGLIKAEGNHALNAQFDFKKLHINLFRSFPNASIVLNDFWLKGVNEFENDTLVSAGQVAGTINLFSLFGNNGYEISKVSLKDIQVKAIVLPDGKVNWDIAKSDSTAKGKDTAKDTAESSPFRLQLQGITVDNLNAIYDDRKGNIYAEVLNLTAKGAGDLGSQHTILKWESDIESVTYKMNNIPFLNRASLYTKMDIDADLVNQKYTLQKNEIRLNAIRAGVDGWLSFHNPGIEMDLKLLTADVGFKEILSLIPAIYTKEFNSLHTDGTVTLAAEAKGVMRGDTLPQFNATMDVKNAMFRYPSLPSGVDQINIHASAKNPGGSADLTEITVNPFNFRMAGNPFSAVVEIKSPASDAAFHAEAKGTLDLGKIKEVYPMGEAQLNGIVNANLSIRGRMSYIEKEQYDKLQTAGTADVSNMKLRIKGMPDVLVHKSLLTFTSQYLQLSETTVHIGKNDITADSRLENYMGYVLQGHTLKGTLNMRSNHFNLNDFTSEGSSSSSAGGQATESAAGAAIIVPANVDLSITANMKEVLMDNMTFNNISGNLAVKGSKADMRNLSMNTMGGAAVMNGVYSTVNKKQPELNGNFKMTNIDFAQAYKELNMVRQMAPIFGNLRGQFSGNMHIQTYMNEQMSPLLETTQGNGSLSTKDLNLSDIEILNHIADAVKQPELKHITVKDMTIDVVIKHGRVTTQPFDIRWNAYNLNLSGSTGLDQTIDYKGKIQLPASTGIGKYTSVDLKIGGTFDSPKISVDAASMAKQTVGAVTDQLFDKLGGKSTEDSTVHDKKNELEQTIEDTTDKIKGLFKKKNK